MILNLTQHKATQEQIDCGVVDLDDDRRKLLSSLLTFDVIPNKQEVEHRANDIALLVIQNGLGGDEDDPIIEKAMIGGAPFLMPALESMLMDHYIKPVYAFSKRESKEKMLEGKTVKTNVFKHIGFVELY